MDAPNSDYLSPLCGNNTSELCDAAVLLVDDETEAKATQIDGHEHLNPSPAHYALSSGGFSSQGTQPRNTEISGNPQKSLWPPPQKSVGVVTNFSLSTWLSQNHTKRPIVGAGMENLGNTCFLNSVLQCFIHTVPLLDAFLPNGHLVHSNCKKEGFCLLCSLRDLIVGSLTRSLVSPCSLADNLIYTSSSFKRFRQEDAHEFLQFFLDRLEICHDSDSKGCMSSQSDNIVKQVFGGRVVSHLKCCNCGHCSDTYEPSVDLSLEIDDANDLVTALQSFTRVERIGDPETNFTCGKCKKQVSAEKKLSFDRTPSVAVFQLKRFKNEGRFVQKIQKRVSFPLHLDLLPFTDSSKKKDVGLTYALYAIVVHVGSTSLSGHYYCFIRLSPNMWCKFDDSTVVLVREDFVLSQEAYVLFYAKEGTPWFSSFVERQKEFVHSSIWNTSPKSVLDNVDTITVSPSLKNKSARNANAASHDFGREHGGAYGDEIKHSGPIKNKIDSKGSASNLHRVSDLVAVHRSDTSVPSLPKPKKVSPILLKKVSQSQEVSELANYQKDTQTALRSPSPEIYREDSPDAGGFSIPRDHLRLVDRMSCKRRLEKDMDDMEVKQACSLIKKTMPSSRGQQLLAAMRGPKNEASVDRKKSRRSGLSNESTASAHHDSSMRRKLRRLVAGTNR